MLINNKLNVNDGAKVRAIVPFSKTTTLPKC